MLSMACSALLHLGNLPSGNAPVQGNVVLASSIQIGKGEYYRSGKRSQCSLPALYSPD